MEQDGSVNSLHFSGHPLPRPLKGRPSREKCKGVVLSGAEGRYPERSGSGVEGRCPERRVVL